MTYGVCHLVRIWRCCDEVHLLTRLLQDNRGISTVMAILDLLCPKGSRCVEMVLTDIKGILLEDNCHKSNFINDILFTGKVLIILLEQD